MNHKQGTKYSKQYVKTKFPTLIFHQQSRCDFAQKGSLWALRCARNSSMFVSHRSKIDILLTSLITRCACFVIVIPLLLPPIHRNVQHHDRTRRGNSTLCSLWMFRFESCILFLGMHSSSGSRTRIMTQILGMNHGWNHTFITRLDEAMIALLTFALCGNLHIVLSIELRHQFGNILLFNVAFFLRSRCSLSHQLPFFQISSGFIVFQTEGGSQCILKMSAIFFFPATW